ncbi:F-box/kelch-repeat protein-like protein, partial [Tanacetum coccineum]
DQEAVKECYKEYIGMVKNYYEEAKRSRHGEPRDVAVNCRGTAGKERPHADARIDAEVEEMLDGTPRKKSRTARDDVKMEGNKNKRRNSRNFCGGTTQREETRLIMLLVNNESILVNLVLVDCAKTSNVFSYLTPCSLARAMAACRHWHDCGRETRQIYRHRQPWFIALPTRSTSRQLCFVHDPIQRSWHLLNLEHVPSMTRPVSTIGGQGLILFKSTGGVPIRLSVCNPFTGQFGHLPHLQKSRTNPAVGVREDFTNHFKLYVAGGMDKWKELGVPMGDTLEFATLVPCDRKVAVVGGTHDGNVLVWELGDDDEWILIKRMPLELAKRFAGIEGGVYLYKDIASAMVVWRRVKNHKNKWEWCSADGCNTVSGKKL